MVQFSFIMLPKIGVQMDQKNIFKIILKKNRDRLKIYLNLIDKGS